MTVLSFRFSMGDLGNSIAFGRRQEALSAVHSALRRLFVCQLADSIPTEFLISVHLASIVDIVLRFLSKRQLCG